MRDKLVYERCTNDMFIINTFTLFMCGIHIRHMCSFLYKIDWLCDVQVFWKLFIRTWKLPIYNAVQVLVLHFLVKKTTKSDVSRIVYVRTFFLKVKCLTLKPILFLSSVGFLL